MYKIYKNLKRFKISLVCLLLINNFGNTADFNATTLLDITPTFYDFPFEYSINKQGRAYFEAKNVATDKNGLYLTGGPGVYQPSFYQEGEAAYDLTNVSMTGFIWWKTNNNAFAYVVGLEGDEITDDNDRAMYAGNSLTGHRLVYQLGDEMPLMPGSIIAYPSDNMQVNEAGDVVFKVQFFPDANNLDFSTLRTAILLSSGSNLNVVASGTSSALISDFSRKYGPLIDNNANVTFIADLDGVFKVWTGQTNKLTSVIAVGDMAPILGNQEIIELNDINISTSTLSFVSRLANGNRALYSRFGSDLRLVKQHNGPLARVNSSANGKLSYLKYSSSSNIVAIESEQDDVMPSEIATETQQAPEFPKGTTISDLESSLSSNDFRQVVFNARLAGDGISEANNEGVWLYDPTYGLQPVIREGSSVELDIADTRLVFSSRDAQISHRGEMTMKADFQDNSSALIVIKKNPSEIVFYDGFE